MAIKIFGAKDDLYFSKLFNSDTHLSCNIYVYAQLVVSLCFY